MGFVGSGLRKVSGIAGNSLVLESIGDQEEGWNGKVGIGFYMCLCGCWCQVIVLSRAGANSMIMAWDGYGGLGNSGFEVC